MQNTKIVMSLVLSAGLAVERPSVAATECQSEKSLVFVNTDTSSFWRTASGAAFTVPVRYPSGATTATLTVAGAGGYARTYENVPEGDYSVTLPAAANLQSENVYELTLDFGTGFAAQIARIGLIDGLAVGAEGETRCIFPSGTRKWSRVAGRSVVPVPYGSSTVTVGGTPIETGLGGAQGWVALSPLEIGVERTLAVSGETFGVSFNYEVDQVGYDSGTKVHFR